MYRISMFFLVFFLMVRFAWGADTLRVMQYNLLYYDQYNSFCTPNNNNVDSKDGYLKTILGFFQPDIFTVNELNEAVVSADRILNNTLNVNGISHYRRANFMGNTYTSSGGIISMLYYNSSKLALKSQTYITSSPRNVMVYKLYYLPTLTKTPNDTIFLTCFVLHPKAGNTAAARDQRATTATLIMNHITSQAIDGAVMLMGDLNIYKASESSFVTYTTPTTSGFRFFDPMDAIGNWNNNPAFAYVHTQSTSTSGGCKASGGMDDRFDFILTSSSLLDDNSKLHYIDGSYWALGQDGNRFNGSLVNPTNNSLPSDIIMAMSHMSDHLPVTLKLYVDSHTTDNPIIRDNQFNISFNNPVSDILNLYIYSNSPRPVSIDIFNILGLPVMLQTHGRFDSNGSLPIPVGNLPKGLYLLRVSLDGKGTIVKKFIKN